LKYVIRKPSSSEMNASSIASRMPAEALCRPRALLRRPLEVVDVRRRAVPPEDRALLVADGDRAGLEPAVRAVLAADAELGVERLAVQLLGRTDDVGEPGLDDAAGHPRELGGGQRLDEPRPRLLLDGAEAERPVGAHAGEDDADAALLLVLGERAEEEVDGEVEAARRHLREEVEHAMQDGHVLVRRDDVHAVALDLLAVLDLDHGHRRRALEQLHHRALVRRVEVLDDDVGHPAVGRHVLEELLERLEPAGRRADADDGEGALVLGRRLGRRSGGGRLLGGRLRRCGTAAGR
jgi:hypothetical protein